LEIGDLKLRGTDTQAGREVQRSGCEVREKASETLEVEGWKLEIEN
jgi:hypothetical protein